jgi:hypothetical protein
VPQTTTVDQIQILDHSNSLPEQNMQMLAVEEQYGHGDADGAQVSLQNISDHLQISQNSHTTLHGLQLLEAEEKGEVTEDTLQAVINHDTVVNDETCEL